MFDIKKQLADEFNISERVVTNILNLIDEGASIPFIARYRKEATQGLSDIQLRDFNQRQSYLSELNQRRSTIIELLKSEQRLSTHLEKAFQQAKTKKEVEDLYLPYKKSKVSKTELAKKLGLEKLANTAWNSWKNWDENSISIFLEQLNISERKINVLEAKELLIELFSEEIILQLDFINSSKNYIHKNGNLISKVIRGKKETGEKYKDYFDYSEVIHKAPSHRLLALLRGKKEGILKLSIELKEDKLPHLLLDMLTRLDLHYSASKQTSYFQTQILDDIWCNKIRPKAESLIFSELKENADIDATNVFAQNLKDLLMSPPAGQKSILALDPGFRNGVKIAAIDKHGNHIAHTVIYPHPPQNKIEESKKSILSLIKKHDIELIAIGNGTASRETEKLVNTLIDEASLDVISIMVSESGASIYSASEIASKEFPDLDVTIRGAISIARRLQDPLAELIKIDPQSIGVGQYQHDIKGKQLQFALDHVVESCVNNVGVDLNLASASLLTHVSGLSAKLADNIIQFRNENGAIKSRIQLKKIKGIGDKCFEQCAGFLRIQDAKHPLDASGVHPESYPFVKLMANRLTLDVKDLMGNKSAIDQLKIERSRFTEIDDYTFNDILTELAKPGRDPRPEFTYVTFDKNVENMADLTPGLELEGVATNIAAFGVFVDIGVHQDGLIHISQLANRFVKNPADLVKVGQILKVEVLEVDENRKRIALKAVGL